MIPPTPVADVDDAGILLAGTDQDRGALGREGLQHRACVLVGTVLGPHHGEDAELGVGRRTAEDIEDLLVLVGSEVVLGDEFGGDGRFVHQRKGGRRRPTASRDTRESAASNKESKRSDVYREPAATGRPSGGLE
jgi:hypothetical protein